MTPYNVIDIANKLLAKASSDDSDELISNLKLQKLLYYMQGFHLAYFGEPLFAEEIEAWKYGPVVPSVYNQYKNFVNQGIKYTDAVIELEPQEEKLFNAVYKVYATYSAIGLMEMTHNETPWKSVKAESGSIIPQKTMMSFFKKRIKK